MNRRNAIIVSLFLALALVLGMTAMVRTAGLGATAAASSPSRAQIAQRNHQLDRFEAQLRAEAKRRPPALPAMPSTGAGTRGAAAAQAPATQPPQVIYVRQRSSAQLVSRHGEHETEHEAEHGHDLGHEGGEDD